MVLKRHNLLSRESKTGATTVIEIDMSNFYSFRQCGRVNCIVVVLPIYMNRLIYPKTMTQRTVHDMKSLFLIKCNDMEHLDEQQI